ncbi:MAG TPA: alpha/beta hydrolase [Sedimentisphaerales bacterium]|nr:alpha/beta hydrolase [Sedimentisphaerales bacterium]HRS11453.1 alpha/beta hydrolase [Sedimentisphaerales bacterium]HRV48009.1 alpha/beta hydrolase [Sedimentisphaerales bacterium]
MGSDAGFLDIDGARIYYEDRGAGEAVIMIHGFAMDRRIFDMQFELFAERFRVVRYDLRGFGRSDLPTGPYSTLDDLRIMMDRLGIEKACIIGLSLGGSLAVEFALTCPQRVTGLVLAGSTLRGYPYSDAYVQEFLYYRKIARRQGIAVAQTEMLGNPLLRSIAKKPELFVHIQAMIRDYSGFHWLRHDPHRVFYPPAIERLGEITCPVQIIIGQHDVDDLQGVARRLIREIRHARCSVLPGVGHIVNMEAPERFNEIVLEFLDSLSADASDGPSLSSCIGTTGRT